MQYVKSDYTIVKGDDFMLSKETTKRYQVIKNVTSQFNSNYNNTAVDTYAFYKVLTSDEFNMLVYLNANTSTNSTIKACHDLCDFMMLEVNKIYERNSHHILEPEIYHQYILDMMLKIKKVQH